MADDSQQERTESPTSKRRKEFRDKGQVAQSKEINTAALLAGSVLLWLFYGPAFWHRLQQLMAGGLRQTGSFTLTDASLMHLVWGLSVQAALLLLPVFLLTLVVGFLSSFLQVGPLFTTKPFTDIDLSRFNPLNGLGRMVSKRALLELVKSLLKVVLVAALAWRTVENEFAGALDLMDMAPVQMMVFLGQLSLLVLAKTTGLILLLAILDYGFVRYEMEEKMKMTKQEVKEEHKESEGDPRVKSRIRSLQYAMARRRMMAEVPKADVVVTNPTHYAVALRYERSAMDAPRVVAKGADHMAARIRELARENRVPIVENKPVARALYKVDLNATIPEELFKAVAEILAYVYSLKRS